MRGLFLALVPNPPASASKAQKPRVQPEGHWVRQKGPRGGSRAQAVMETLHHSEGPAWRESAGVKPTGSKLGKQGETRAQNWLALPGFSRLVMWL